MTVRPRAVTFDAFGTLVRMVDPAPRLRASLRGRLGVDVPLERCRAAMRAEVSAYHGLPAAGDRAALAAVRATCAGVLAEALDAGLTAQDVGPSLIDAVRFLPAEGAHAVLAGLRSAGIRVAVVSNWDVSLRDHLADLGLAPLLDLVVLSGEVGIAKPDPAIYRVACGRLGLPPAAVAHVGDHPRNDVDAARAAGLPAVLVDAAPVPARMPSARDLAGAARLALTVG